MHTAFPRLDLIAAMAADATLKHMADSDQQAHSQIKHRQAFALVQLQRDPDRARERWRTLIALVTLMVEGTVLVVRTI